MAKGFPIMKMSEAEFQRQVAEATKRGDEYHRTHPSASAVRFDRRARMIVVTLNKGTILSVPVDLIPEIKGLTDEELAKVAILGPGYDLDWEPLDIQVSIAWLLTGMYGTSALDASADRTSAVMSAIGRKGGSATSKAKATSSRANGAKGGRPRLTRKRSVATAK